MQTLEINQIYNQYKAKVLSSLIYATNDREASEELANDVFMKVYTHLEIFDVEKAQLGTWISKIAQNTLTDYWRKKKLETTSINHFMNDDGIPTLQIAGTLNANDLIESKETRVAIEAAMDKLGSKYREIAELYFYKNKKYIEIAEILDIPMSNVKVTLLRAKAMLQAELQVMYASL